MRNLYFVIVLLFTSFIINAQIPVNNDCVNRETITIGTTNYIQYSVDFTEATESLDASCETVSVDNRDVWYEFTMPIEGVLYVSNISALNYVSLYSTCGGTEIACGQDDSSFGVLTSGTTYILRVSFRFDATVNFRVQAFATAVNNDCANSETITMSTANYTEFTVDTRTATESTDASCEDATDNNVDVWYDFVMPVNGNIQISNVSFETHTFSIYDSCGGTEVDCNFENGYFTNLTSGTTYMLRVSAKAANAKLFDFRLQAFAFATNNDCTNSQTIVVNTANFDDYAADLRAASESTDSSCETASDINYDLWFDFVMPVNGNISIKQLSGNSKTTLYDACGGTEISCKSGSQQFLYGLTSGTSYKLRVSSFVISNIASMRIQAFEEAVNDECANAELITIGTTTFTEYIVDTRRATESLDASCETASEDNLDLWYEFVMPVTGNLQISNITFSHRLTLYNSCSGVEILCDNGNNIFNNLAFGVTYLLRVAQTFNNAKSQNVRLQAFENLFNDDCSNPQNVVVELNTINTYGANVAAATQSNESSCEPSSETLTVLDVWFSFTMPINGDLQLTDLDTFAQYYSLYETCGVADVQCFINSGLFTNLTLGTTYLLKASMLSTQADAFSFNLQVKDPSLGINENELVGLSIFPNPATNFITIKNKNNFQLTNVSIVDLRGRIIKTINHKNLFENTTIDVSELSSGTYLLVVKSEKGHLVKRIVKQ